MQIKKILHSIPKINIVKMLLLLFLSVSCFFKAAQHKQNLELYNDKITVIPNISISGIQANEVQKRNELSDNPYAVTIWGERQDITIYNPDLKRETIVNQIIVCGRTDAILSGTYTLDINDKNGCLIDENTAYELFGDSKTTGQVIVSDNKSYVVRGIIQDMRNIFVRQSTDETGEILDTFTVLRGEETTGTTVNHIFNIFRMQGHLLDYGIVIDLTSTIFLVVPVILFSYLCSLINKCKKYCIFVSDKRLHDETILQFFCKRYPKEYWFWLCIQIFCIIIFAVIILKNFTLIDDYIPTKWSDLGFWKQLLEEKAVSLKYLFITTKKSPEIMFFISFLKANIFNLLSLFFMILLIYEVKIIELKYEIVKMDFLVKR